MSENDGTQAGRPGESGLPGGEIEAPGTARPHRVIGTPSPAAGRDLLGAGKDEPALSGPRTLLDPDAETSPVRRLPAGGLVQFDPHDPDQFDPAEDNGNRRPPREIVIHEQPGASRAEKVVAAFFLLAGLAGVGFIAAYIGLQVRSFPRAVHSNLALGASLTVVMLSMGVGMVIWVRRIMPRAEFIEARHEAASEPVARQEFQETALTSTQLTGLTKRPLLRRSLLIGGVPLALAPLVLLRDLGPLPGTSLRHTVWKKGMRLLVYGSNRPIRPEDFDVPGGLITVVPDGYQDNDDALSKAASILIKFQPGELQPPTVMKWTVQNIVCYSKICTHLGCPAALYEQTTHHILCPCHQSTFDAPRGAQVIFGPAPRPLPQLPLMVDADGYLAAAGDFNEPVGPSFWERG